MITQNPIIGHARKKLAGVYARTLYGKNVLQTCPPSTKGKQTQGQLAVCSAFGNLSRLSNQLEASLLNFIYYTAPIGRSRRMQWTKDLGAGMRKVDGEWFYNPLLIQKLGSNPVVSNEPYYFLPSSTQAEIPIEDLSHVGNAIVTEKPLLIILCPSQNICVSLLPYTTIDETTVYLQNISTTFVGKECYIFPLWVVNVGTQRTPIQAFGSFEVSSQINNP